jgi:hypothetical protein
MTAWFRKTAIIAVLVCELFGARDVVACNEWKLLERADTATLSAFAKLDSTPGGALALNRYGYVSVGQQRHTFDLLPQGVLKQQTALVERAVQIVEYAYSHQKPDGTFEYSEKKNPAGAVQSLAFFFGDFGHALLLLDRSEWFQHSPEMQPLRQKLAEVREKSKRSLTWLISMKGVLEKDVKAANRVFSYAAAYILMGRAVGDDQAIAVGMEFLRTALAMTRDDGVALENGGFDSAYQGVSLFVGHSIFCYLPDRFPQASAELGGWLERGATRLVETVEPSGRISTQDNSRVRDDGTGEADNGRPKKLDPRFAILALGYIGADRTNETLREFSSRISRYYFEARKPAERR